MTFEERYVDEFSEREYIRIVTDYMEMLISRVCAELPAETSPHVISARRTPYPTSPQKCETAEPQISTSTESVPIQVASLKSRLAWLVSFRRLFVLIRINGIMLPFWLDLSNVYSKLVSSLQCSPEALRLISYRIQTVAVGLRRSETGLRLTQLTCSACAIAESGR